MHIFQFGCGQPSWLSLDRDALALGDDPEDASQYSRIRKVLVPLPVLQTRPLVTNLAP